MKTLNGRVGNFTKLYFGRVFLRNVENYGARIEKNLQSNLQGFENMSGNPSFLTSNSQYTRSRQNFVAIHYPKGIE